MVRWKSVLVITAATLAPLAAAAEERVFTLQPKTSRVTCKLNATGHEVNGVLALESGQIRFDPSTGAASGEVTIDVRRAETGNRVRDRDMHKNVLETERYPLITFRPNRLEGTFPPSGVCEITLRGIVVMHGTEHDLTLPAKVIVSGDRVTAQTTFEVPYVDWGLHNPSFLFLRVAPVVGVTVNIQGNLRPAAAVGPEHGARRDTRAHDVLGAGTR